VAALVPSACNKPGLRQVTDRYVRSAPGERIEGPYRIPKLMTVRVRFRHPLHTRKVL